MKVKNYIEINTRKIFLKYLVAASLRLNKGPIKNNRIINSDTSTWREIKDNQLKIKNDLNLLSKINNKNLSVIEKTKLILSIWYHFTSHDKVLILPLVKNILKLEQKIELDKVAKSEDVSDSVYVMF